MKRVLMVCSVIVVLLAGGVASLWATGPPEKVEGTAQITGGCCSNQPWGHMVVLRDTDGKAQARVEFLDGTLVVDGDEATIEYAVMVNARTDQVVTAEPELVYETWTGSVGDLIEAGPVTMEIVAVHDAVFGRNDAVDIRFSFTP